MKKIITILSFCFLSTGVFAQCAASDSTIMGANYANDVFYSFKNGVVKTESNSNWHLAISVQRSQFPNNPATGVGIRVNSVKGCNLVKLNGANAANWRAIDTTGFRSLPNRLDSMKTWDMTAFTKEYNPATAPFNFIWGNYNMTSKNVDGSAVFLLYNSTANWYKKVFVKQLAYDTLWNIIISNVDNSDSVNLMVNKNTYKNRLFVYYDVVNKQLNDREPAITAWDAVWTRYTEVVTQNNQTMAYPLTGILLNKGVTVAKSVGPKCNQTWLSKNTVPFSVVTNTIGYDWKYSNMGPFAIVDTFVYFVKTRDTSYYKLSFNRFVGASAGKTVFSLKNESLSNKTIKSKAGITLYPNPAADVVTIRTEATVLNVKVMTATGSEVELPVNNNSIQTSGLSSGLYLLTITTDKGTETIKLIKE